VSVFWGSMTMSLPPASRIFSSDSRLNPPVVWFMLLPHSTTRDGAWSSSHTTGEP